MNIAWGPIICGGTARYGHRGPILGCETAIWGHWGPKYEVETFKNKFRGSKTYWYIWEVFPDQNDSQKYSRIFPGRSGLIFNHFHIALKGNRWRLKIKKYRILIRSPPWGPYWCYCWPCALCFPPAGGAAPWAPVRNFSSSFMDVEVHNMWWDRQIWTLRSNDMRLGPSDMDIEVQFSEVGQLFEDIEVQNME